MKRHRIHTYIIFLFLTLGNILNAQITADIIASDSIGCTGDMNNINFLDNSSGSISTRSWYLDGTLLGSSSVNIVQSFVVPGDYTIRLEVSDGSSSSFDEINVTVHNLPEINFNTNNNTKNCTGSSVEFLDLSSSDAGLSSWNWSFGDGTSSTSQNPSHTFNYHSANGGKFNITLEVTDNNSCSDFLTKTDYIKASPGATIEVSSDNNVSCDLPSTVDFDLTTTGWGDDQNPFQITWDFGNDQTTTEQAGTNSTGQSVYANFNEYDLTISIIDSIGCQTDTVINSFVKIEDYQAQISVEENQCKDAKYLYLNQSSSGNYTWDFDGVEITLRQPIFGFSDTGRYDVTLFVDNGICQDRDTVSIFVSAVEADFSIDSNFSCTTPFNFSLTPDITGNDISYTYNWVLTSPLDSTDSSTNQIANFTVSDEGSYNAKFIVSNQYGCTDTVDKTNVLVINTPDVSFTETATGGCVPLSVFFNSTSTSDQAITNITWDFGDTTISDTGVNYTFTTDGIYAVELSITDAAGCNSSLSRTIAAGVKPTANFTLSHDSICASDSITITNTTLGMDSTGLYDDSNGDGSSDQGDNFQFSILGTSNGNIAYPPSFTDTSYIYKVDTGLFTMRMIANHYGCSDTADRDYYIRGPIARFDAVLSCTNHNYIELNDTSIDGDRWDWNFGDDSTSSLENPNHNYFETGEDYMVNITVHNDDGYGCSDQDSTLLRIRQPIARFDAPADTACAPSEISFNAENSQDAEVRSWYFGEGDTTISNANNNSHYYDNPGNYAVSLEVTDINGCRDTMISIVPISGIKVGFTTDTFRGCLPLLTDLVDTSYSDSIILSRTWEYRVEYTSDNEHRDSIFNATQFDAIIPFDTANSFDSITHITLRDTGFYRVRLTVNTANCSRKLTKTAYLESIKPNAEYHLDASDYFACHLDSIELNNTSTSSDQSNLSYYWDFSYDSTAYQIDDSSESPSFEVEGNMARRDTSYPIVLIVQDTNNCTDTSNYHIKRPLVVHYPKAEFSPVQDTLFCAPSIVQFQNRTLSQAVNEFEWDLTYPDSTVSFSETPNNNYTMPDDYSVRFIVKTANSNCRDTVIKQNHIRAQGAFAEIAFDIDCNLICRGDEILFTLNNTINIDEVAWAPEGTQLPYDTATSYNHTYFKRGTYYPYAVVSNIRTSPDDSLCFRTLNIVSSLFPSITVENIQAGFDIDTNQGCRPLTIRTTDNSILASTYTWKFLDNDSIPDRTPGFEYIDSGTYILRQIVQSEIGCADTSYDTIRVHDLPEVSVNGNDTICLGDTVRLIGEGSGTSYYWTSGQFLNDSTLENPISVPDEDINYYFHVIDSNNCYNQSDSSYKITVIYPVEIDWTAYATYNGDNIYGDSIKTDDDKLKVIAGEELHIQINATSTLPTSTTWEGEYLAIDTGNLNIILPPSFETNSETEYEYTVSVVDELGCPAEDEIIEVVVVDFHPDSTSVKLPTAFTPNGDGLNDVVYPEGPRFEELIEFAIYNRWGELVFQTDDSETGWDGTNLEGKPQNPDKYIYVIKATLESGLEVSLKGEILLVR